MKKMYFMLLCAACVAFVGCSKDDDPTPTPTVSNGPALVKKIFETDRATAEKLLNSFGYTGTGTGSSTTDTTHYKRHILNDSVTENVNYTVRNSDKAITQATYSRVTTTNKFSTVGADFVEKEYGEKIFVKNDSVPFQTTGGYVNITGQSQVSPKTCAEAVTALRTTGSIGCKLSWIKSATHAEVEMSYSPAFFSVPESYTMTFRYKMVEP